MGGRAQLRVLTHLALDLALGMTPSQATARPRWFIVQWREARPPPRNRRPSRSKLALPPSTIADRKQGGVDIKCLNRSMIQ